MSSNKGWHERWFYLRDDEGLFPQYIRRYFKKAKHNWGYGPVEKKPKLRPLLQALVCLQNRGINGVGVFAAFHERRVLPLMRRDHRLDEMVLGALWEGTTMAAEALPHNETMLCVWNALRVELTNEDLDSVPPMRPDPDFIPLVSYSTLVLL